MKPHDALIARLRTFYPLPDAAAEALSRVRFHSAEIERGAFVVRQGDHSDRSCLLLSGFLASTRFTQAGNRQIAAFHVKGDIPDLRSVHLEILDVGLQAVTACQVAYIQHSTVLDLCQNEPKLAAGFWKMTLVDASIHRDWIVALGALDARHRAAHLMCEIFVRQRVIGEATEDTCSFPISQVDMSDALGVSPVHVNRVVQELRSEGLIELKNKTLRVLDWPRLKHAGSFDPAYLHLGEVETG